MTTTTKEIKCSCGSYIKCRPNRNGVVVCPTCKSVHTPEEFRREEEPREIGPTIRF